jgi:predicted metalloprotease with PDZ domain
VNPHSPILSWPARLTASVLLAATPGACLLAADAPPATQQAVKPDGNDDEEAQLEAARKRLEEAAHEVARLSEQMSGAVIAQVMPFVSTGRAIIGVQLDSGEDAAGAHVREVSPGGPAAEAGIRVGDVIVAVNGTAVSGPEPARHVTRIIREVKPDSRVRVRVLREGQPREFVLTARAGPTLFDTELADLPHVLPDVRGAFLLRRPLMDMELASLTPRLGSYFGTAKGVLVVRAPTDGALKLEDGDVILAIDGRDPTSGSHATRILGSYQPGEKIALRILRQHKTLELEATLPARAGSARQGMLQREPPELGSLPSNIVLSEGEGVVLSDDEG